MFAHQVIEDRKKYFNKSHIPIESDFMKIVGTLKNPDINGAVCFSLPEFNELLDITKLKSDNPIPVEKMIEPQYFKMPYKKIWCDGRYSYAHVDKSKATPSHSFCDKWGMLISELGNNSISIISYYHFHQENTWLMEPVWHVVQVKPEGAELKRSWLRIYDNPKNDDAEQRTNILGPGSADGVYVAAAFLKLINCKNITTEVVKAPEALNKKRRKNGKQEIFDYHVLNVTVPGQKQGYREQSEPLSHVRIHLCRGHFKEYTKEHPLFGKLTGLYWWQPHVRGQNKEGIVIKDYKIISEVKGV